MPKSTRGNSGTSVPEATLKEVLDHLQTIVPMTNKQWIDFRYQFDQGELDQKMNFNDFLAMLLRESFFRDTLAEAQIFKQSSRRLVYAQELVLITSLALNMINSQKASMDADKEI